MSSARPPIIDLLRLEVQDTKPKERLKNAHRTLLSAMPEKELFFIKPADQWLLDAAKQPEPQQLLGTLWHQGELCILFADTNVGKSILAVQIGCNLGKQCGVEPFGYHLPDAQKVLYIDFELNAQQFKSRYSNGPQDMHHFGQNFIRAEFNPGGDDPDLYQKYEDYVRSKIDYALTHTKATVLIIDNITCMGSTANHAGAALPLMKTLKALKTKHRISVLVLAHTPKRSLFKPITSNDLQGSKMLINFADSAFAIGQSQQHTQLRYIKQIKQRNTANDYGAQHVALFRVVKQQSFLGFEFEGYDTENAHLQKTGVVLRDDIQQKIAELHRQGLSLRQIADHLKIGSSSVRRALVRLGETG